MSMRPVNTCADAALANPTMRRNAATDAVNFPILLELINRPPGLPYLLIRCIISPAVFVKTPLHSMLSRRRRQDPDSGTAARVLPESGNDQWSTTHTRSSPLMQFAVGATFVAVSVALAATQPPATESQTGASRVALAAVSDARNRPLVDVSADDFVIQEDGANREVLSVRPADYPIVVLVDTGPAA